MLESELFLSRGLKLHTCHTLPNANCDRCLIAPGGGSGIPAVYWGGERGGDKIFLRDSLERGLGQRGAEAQPDLLLLSLPFPLPLSFFSFFFFFPPPFCSVHSQHLQQSQHFRRQRAGFPEVVPLTLYF